MAPEAFRRRDREPEFDTKCDIWSLGITAIEMAEGKTPYADQELVSDLIINNDSPRLISRTWSQTFVSFLESCLEKDPSRRWSVEELLQHPFIAELPPTKTIRAEIEEHLRAVQNRPAKQGLRAVRWAREQLRRAREQLRRAREQLRRAREQLRGAREQLRQAMEHLRPCWAMEHLRPCWTMEHLRRAFCAIETSPEQKEAQQMALEGFACV
ncbi:traf2 and NCK-interacting protein kinase [Xenopus tropicalis]|nr:traf2 and NCK-interacting protein kinase [Xenopus tropicalis]